MRLATALASLPRKAEHLTLGLESYPYVLSREYRSQRAVLVSLILHEMVQVPVAAVIDIAAAGAACEVR
jgi:hypothetical protein